MPPMFKQSDKLDNAHPVVERFLPVNVREAALSRERPTALDFSVFCTPPS
jgi:hypothetical protein